MTEGSSRWDLRSVRVPGARTTARSAERSFDLPNGPWLQGFGHVLHWERAVAGVEEVTNEVGIDAGDPAPSPAGGAAVVQMGVQWVPPDAAADGEAGEARNGRRDLQRVVKVVVVIGVRPRTMQSAVRPPRLGGRGDRGRVVGTVEALDLHHAGVLQADFEDVGQAEEAVQRAEEGGSRAAWFCK